MKRILFSHTQRYGHRLDIDCGQLFLDFGWNLLERFGLGCFENGFLVGLVCYRGNEQYNRSKAGCIRLWPGN